MQPPRPRSLVVVDDAQNRRDAATLSQARGLIDTHRIDDAFALLEPLTQRENPTSITAQATLLAAALLSMQSRGKEVIDVLDRLDSALGRGVVVDRGFALMLRAQALRLLRRLDEAVVVAHAAVDVGVTPARLLVLADCCGSAGDVVGAIDALSRARALDADNVAVLGQLCGWLAKAGAASDDEFAAFVAKDDGSADFDRNAAFALACRGDVEGASAAIARAFAKEPAVTRGYVDDEEAFAAFRATLPCVSGDTARAD